MNGRCLQGTDQASGEPRTRYGFVCFSIKLRIHVIREMIGIAGEPIIHISPVYLGPSNSRLQFIFGSSKSKIHKCRREDIVLIGNLPV